MKNWIIERKGDINKYLIVTEKSIWISNNHKELNIEELIENKNLESVQSFRFDQLKELILIETNTTIKFVFKDKEEEKQSFEIERSIFGEIRTYLKLNLKGIKIKNYSLLKQVFTQLSTLAIGIVFILLTYETAVDIENGESIPESRRSTIIKKIIYYLADLIGVYGSIIIGVIFVLTLIFIINKKLQNPKKGVILEFGKFVSLKG